MRIANAGFTWPLGAGFYEHLGLFGWPPTLLAPLPELRCSMRGERLGAAMLAATDRTKDNHCNGATLGMLPTI